MNETSYTETEQDSIMTLAREVIDTTPERRRTEGPENMRHYCDTLLRQLKTFRRRGSGRLIVELTLLRKQHTDKCERQSN